ncbi:hypothetical protein BFW86_14360 [Pseudomonas fluorescens]|nr:hypothetical protein BFW86_14360 [Pseudomonas fluorescens]
MYDELIYLSELSHILGLIGLAEFNERVEVWRWLITPDDRARDPRRGRDETLDRQESRESQAPDNTSTIEQAMEDDSADQWTHLLVLNKWVFTIGDADCYPSVPHGHFRRKTNPWPKLNPYTGGVFVGPHQEDKTRRLTKAEMQMLWSDEEFLSYCHSQIEWYSQFAPQYQFVHARFGRNILPRWRRPQ